MHVRRARRFAQGRTESVQKVEYPRFLDLDFFTRPIGDINLLSLPKINDPKQNRRDDE
jgi:hypothetical protein